MRRAMGRRSNRKMISAVSARNEPRFMVVRGGAVFADLIKYLNCGQRRGARPHGRADPLQAVIGRPPLQKSAALICSFLHHPRTQCAECA